ncbi:CRTAC1 family protein, partial [Winogradskyella sp.]
MKKIGALILIFSVLYVTKGYSQIFFNESAFSYGLECTFGSGFVGGGISFVDFDDDGWDDITLGTEGGEAVLFFKNNNGSFTPVFPNIVDDFGENKQVVWVDFDNDGDKDLYVAGYQTPNKLYRNDGNSNFTNITLESGLAFSGLKNFGAAWGDYDNDGYLDVFLTFRSSTEPNRLFHNNGDSTFSDVSSVAGISDQGHLTFCASFFDYDKDGWQDIYMANDRNTTTNILYRNNGNGTFSDVSEVSGTNLRMDAMSTTIGDYNNDGWMDIYVTNTNDIYLDGEVGNALLNNNGDGTFTNVAANTGTQFNSIAWGAVFLDADNDQDLDLYVSGMLDGSSSLPSAFYENDGFHSFTIPSDAGFQNDNEESYSNAIGDLDNDGFPEIVVLNEYANIFLWKNLSNLFNSNNWLKIRLEGVASNKDGLGSYIEVNTNSGSQYRYTLCGEGYLSQNSSTEFIGLGDETSINYVKVKWLSGIEDIIYDVETNQTLEITEGNFLSTNEFNHLVDIEYQNPV